MFFKVYLEAALSARGDWTLAGELLDKATQMAGRWERTYEAGVYAATARIYYERIRFPDYELMRSGVLTRHP